MKFHSASAVATFPHCCRTSPAPIHEKDEPRPAGRPTRRRRQPVLKVPSTRPARIAVLIAGDKLARAADDYADAQSAFSTSLGVAMLTRLRLKDSVERARGRLEMAALAFARAAGQGT